eukprot:gene17203-22723_t
MLTLQMKFNESVPCFLEAYTLGERLALTRLLSSKGWIDSWDNFEYISAEVENEAYHCYTSSSSFCYIESAFGFEYTDIPGYITKYIYTMASYSKDSRFLVHPHSKSILSKQIGINNGPKRLKLGVISSDFGVHPVSSLIRVTGDLGWWGVNISLSVEHFDILSGVNTQEGASIIASKKIDILIDLNGHTKNSGLSYMSHKPAPIQLSYLGLPSTTGSTFINYYIGDYIALPPEISSHFTENDRLLLTPHTPWIDHIYKKTAIDLLFDTITKNGHTTGLDGIWAGVPVISLAGGRCMPQRAGESIAIGMNNEIGLVYSLKEYEDLIDKLSQVPDGLLDNELIYLNIGGMVKTPSWLNVNVQDQPYKGMKTHTDLIRPMHNLHGFPNYSVAAIYSSHNLEHNPIGNKMLFQTLTEWRRVLRPAGLLMISVPDLRTMAKIYLNDSLSFQDRWMTTMMIYGSQSNAFDYHFIGFDEEILTSFLVDYGFCNIERVQAFNLFEDASTIVFQGYSISLNIAAKKCITEEDLILFDGELKDIKHNATPYIR